MIWIKFTSCIFQYVCYFHPFSAYCKALIKCLPCRKYEWQDVNVEPPRHKRSITQTIFNNNFQQALDESPCGNDSCSDVLMLSGPWDCVLYISKFSFAFLLYFSFQLLYIYFRVCFQFQNLWAPRWRFCKWLWLWENFWDIPRILFSKLTLIISYVQFWFHPEYLI